MNTCQKIATAYILFINVVAYVIMWFDKFLSKKRGIRVSEQTLFILALLLGAIGIYVGMKAPLYHKAGKNKFKIGVPFLIVVNAASVYVIFELI